MRIRPYGLLILLTLLFYANPVTSITAAQSDPAAITAATSSRPDIQSFPDVKVYLVVKDGQDRFVHGLTPAELGIVEDDKTLPVRELHEERPGAQFVVAYNPGPSFALRNSRGDSRANVIKSMLETWAKSRQGSTLDDLSLLVTNGREDTHLRDPLKFASALDIEQIDVRQAVPSLDTLQRAVEIAADAPSRPGMGRSVLFITPPIEDQTGVTLQNIITRAKEQGVSISIWSIPVPGSYYPNAEKQFTDLTSQTGGQYYTFADEQPILNIEDLLESFRSVYQVSYDSQIRASGSHQLAVDIQAASGAITTPVQTFDFDIQPPEPAFVSPPLEIKRNPPLDNAGKVDSEAALTDYLPEGQEIQALVSFPDERVRPLIRTSLYVDGKIVQENRQPPFDRFIWDLKDYSSSGTHMLRVEAEDNLGLVGATIDRLVQLTIEQPARSPWSWVSRNAPGLSLLGALIAGSTLLLVLLLGGQLRPRQLGKARAGRTGRRKSDPVTQPVAVKVEAPAKRLSGWVNRIHWPQRSIPPQASAFLSRISDVDSDVGSTPIPLFTDEITLGSDPNLATLVLNDTSVEGLHARILHKEDGSYRLIDEGSIAGTWINYTPISREGARLENGDLVHIGRIGFRFTNRQPGQIRKAVVIPVNPSTTGPTPPGLPPENGG